MNNVKLLHIMCCFFKFFNSPVALKFLKKFGPPRKSWNDATDYPFPHITQNPNDFIDNNFRWNATYPAVTKPEPWREPFRRKSGRSAGFLSWHLHTNVNNNNNVTTAAVLTSATAKISTIGLINIIIFNFIWLTNEAYYTKQWKKESFQNICAQVML